MKKQLFKLLGILSLLLISVTVFAQTDRRQISGKITDDNGEPLSGVTVSLKDANIATMTNDAGD